MSTPTKIAAIGSMTAAIKAQRALAAADLDAHIVSLSPGDSRKGCAYGIEFQAELEGAIRHVLRKERISVTEFLQKGGTPL